MQTRPTSKALTRDSELGELGDKARNFVKRNNMYLAIALSATTIYLLAVGRPGAGAFALISLGSCIALGAWSSSAIGLPLLPMMVAQGLVIYGLPIAVGHEVILTFPPEFVLRAGAEVLIFNVTMIMAWKLGMQLFSPSPPISYALQESSREGTAGWTRIGFAMIIGTTGFEVTQSMGIGNALIAALPNGSNSIVTALISVISACGFFLVSMTVGGAKTSAFGRFTFWVLLIVNAMMAASDFLLYSAAANLITVAIGFFWSSGRLPWRYLTAVMLVLSFLNTGKTTMRERYWGENDQSSTQASISQLPSVYAEWIEISYDAILENQVKRNTSPTEVVSHANKNQTLLDRIDNLQNLLYVIDAVEVDHKGLLHGATYYLIPPLLIPRILYPDKPRSHEGQVLLNVHFGRQDYNSTLSTYIAWGLLAEAYGNFGPVAGAIAVGVFLGLIFAWIENMTAKKLVLSMEGFLSLSLLMNLMNSFEMVASVLVTSTFQSFMIVVVASYPFVRRTNTAKRIAEEA